MSNILDYIHWRGDLTFVQDPPNPVDNLIFSEIAYCDFRGIVPTAQEGGSLTLAETCDRYLAARMNQLKLINNPRPLLIAAAASRRFRNVLLSAYADQIDAEKQEQFAAVTFTVPGIAVYVAFRGTDTTITGWREDFNMSFLPETPGQQDAVRYLNEAAERTGLPLVVGGHSKGGNLAVYAAAFTDPAVQKRVMYVCSNDGPGFNSKVAGSEEYAGILPKVRLILPESSLVGILMANRGQRLIVRSKGKGVMQHNPYTWEILGPSFLPVDSLSPSSLLLDETIRRWLDEMSDDERRSFTEAIFVALEEDKKNPEIDLRQTPANTLRALMAGLRILTGDRQAAFLQAAQKLLLAGGSALVEDGRRRALKNTAPLRAALQNIVRSLSPGQPSSEEKPGEHRLESPKNLPV